MQKRVNMIVAVVHKIREGLGKPYGFVCVADSNGSTILLFLVGEIEEDGKMRAELSRAYCQERAQRLGRNPDHISSWESRDEELHKLGGAIRSGKLIYSFSVFSEEWNEACAITMARLNGSSPRTRKMRKLSQTSRKHAAELYHKLLTSRKIRRWR